MTFGMAWPLKHNTKDAIHEKKKIKLDFVKIKNFCSVKDNVKRMKRQTTGWKKIFAKTHVIRNCYPKYTKNSSNSTIK